MCPHRFRCLQGLKAHRCTYLCALVFFCRRRLFVSARLVVLAEPLETKLACFRLFAGLILTRWIRFVWPPLFGWCKNKNRRTMFLPSFVFAMRSFPYGKTSPNAAFQRISYRLSSVDASFTTTP